MGHEPDDPTASGQAFSPCRQPPPANARKIADLLTILFQLSLAIRRGLTRGKIMVAVAVLSQIGCAVSTKPLTDIERNERISTDMHQLFAGQEPVTDSITLSEAIARAIKYNIARQHDGAGSGNTLI